MRRMELPDAYSCVCCGCALLLFLPMLPYLLHVLRGADKLK
jgi:hypothetical protein